MMAPLNFSTPPKPKIGFSIDSIVGSSNSKKCDVPVVTSSTSSTSPSSSSHPAAAEWLSRACHSVTPPPPAASASVTAPVSSCASSVGVSVASSISAGFLPLSPPSSVAAAVAGDASCQLAALQHLQQQQRQRCMPPVVHMTSLPLLPPGLLAATRPSIFQTNAAPHLPPHHHPHGPHPPTSAAAAAAQQLAVFASQQTEYPLLPWLHSRHGRLFPAAAAAAAAAAGVRLPGADFPAFFLQPFRKPKRIRTAFSPSQLLKLEHAFEKNHYVVGQERKQLAHSLNLSETQVKVWFQNRRTKHKRVQDDEPEGTIVGSTNKHETDGHNTSIIDTDASTPTITSSRSLVVQRRLTYMQDDEDDDVEDHVEDDEQDEMVDIGDGQEDVMTCSDTAINLALTSQ